MMIKTLFAAAASLVLLATGAAAEEKPFDPSQAPIIRLVRVTDNPGGVLSEFLAQVDGWSRAKVRVEIEGNCYSACTLYSAIPTACVMEGAELHFHAPFLPLAKGTRAYDPRMVDWMTRQYPDAIQKWIARHGGLTADWIVLRGEALKALVPSCDEAPNS
jgi:hypothetical protein